MTLGQEQEGPRIVLPCGHRYEPQFESGGRLVGCGEQECGRVFIVKAHRPHRIIYTVTNEKGME